MLRETFVLEPQNVGLYTLGGGGLKTCTVCTLMKMLTFLVGPLWAMYIIHISVDASSSNNK